MTPPAALRYPLTVYGMNADMPASGYSRTLQNHRDDFRRVWEAFTFTYDHFAVFGALGMIGPTSAEVIAARLDIPAAAVERALLDLEAAGIVSHDPGDWPRRPLGRKAG